MQKAKKAQAKKEPTELHWFMLENFIRQIFGPHHESLMLKERREKLIAEQYEKNGSAVK